MLLLLATTGGVYRSSDGFRRRWIVRRRGVKLRRELRTISCHRERTTDSPGLGFLNPTRRELGFALGLKSRRDRTGSVREDCSSHRCPARFVTSFDEIG